MDRKIRYKSEVKIQISRIYITSDDPFFGFLISKKKNALTNSASCFNVFIVLRSPDIDVFST